MATSADSEIAAEKPSFTCSLCGFTCHYDYFGTKPPFSKSVVLLEDAYIIHDPFSPTSSHLAIGARCCLCSKEVCVGQKCSLFYTKRFCVPCVQKNMGEFPEEIQKVGRKHSLVASEVWGEDKTIDGTGGGRVFGVKSKKSIKKVRREKELSI